VSVHGRVWSRADGRAQKHFRTRQTSPLESSEKLPTHVDVCACLHECIVNPAATFLREGAGWLGAAHTKDEFLKHYQPARANVADEMAKNRGRLWQGHQN